MRFVNATKKIIDIIEQKKVSPEEENKLLKAAILGIGLVLDVGEAAKGELQRLSDEDTVSLFFG